MRKYGRRILSVTLLIGALGTLRAQAQSGFLPVQGLTAYDSVGKRIGNVLGFGFTTVGELPTVAFSKDSITVVLGLGKNRFFGTWIGLAFASTDCTETAFFLELSSLPGTPLTPTFIRDGAVYVPDASAPLPSLPLTVKSFFVDSIPEPECLTGEFEATDAVQAKNLGDLPTFTPPFSVR